MGETKQTSSNMDALELHSTKRYTFLALLATLLFMALIIRASAASSWSVQTVDSTGDMGDSNSLALDSVGNPHISYYGRTNGDLKYAVFTESFPVTFTATGLSDCAGAVLTVDSVNYNLSDLPVSFSWNIGTVHTFNYSSSLTNSTGETHVWTSTSGLATVQSGNLTVFKAGMVQATYQVNQAQSRQRSLQNIYFAVVAVAVVIAVVAALSMLHKRIWS